MLARVCGSLMEGCNVWGSPLRFVQVPGLGCHAKTVQNPAKTFKNKNQVVALPRLRWPQGCRMSSPKEGAKWSVINLNMLHGFPDFPSSGYFHVIRGQSTHQNTVVIWGALDIISWQEIHLKDSKSGMECRENDMSTSESYPVLNPCWHSHGAESSSPAATLPPPAPVVCRDASSAANFPWTHMPRRHPRHQPSPLSGQPQHRLGRWMAECVPNRLFGSWEVRKKSPQSFNLIIVSFAVSFQWLW